MKIKKQISADEFQQRSLEIATKMCAALVTDMDPEVYSDSVQRERVAFIATQFAHTLLFESGYYLEGIDQYSKNIKIKFKDSVEQDNDTTKTDKVRDEHPTAKNKLIKEIKKLQKDGSDVNSLEIPINHLDVTFLKKIKDDDLDVGSEDDSKKEKNPIIIKKTEDKHSRDKASGDKNIKDVQKSQNTQVSGAEAKNVNQEKTNHSHKELPSRPSDNEVNKNSGGPKIIIKSGESTEEATLFDPVKPRERNTVQPETQVQNHNNKIKVANKK